MSLQANPLRPVVRQVAVGLIVAMLSPIAACAQVWRAGFDNTTGAVRYCGNSHAYHDEIVAAARDDCASDRGLQTMRCNTEPTGAHASTVALGHGHSATSISQSYGECCDFKCEALPQSH